MPRPFQVFKSNLLYPGGGCQPSDNKDEMEMKELEDCVSIVHSN